MSRVQKCKFLVGAKTVPTGMGLQTTLCHAAPYRADYRNLQKFGSTYCHGNVLQPKQCLYQKEATGVRHQKCNFPIGAKTVATGKGLQTTSCHATPYRTANGNFQKFGSTYRPRTMFAPKQCLSEKKATAVDSPKM